MLMRFGKRAIVALTSVLIFILAAFAADAQQGGKVHRIGFLWDSPAVWPHALEAFRLGLRELGWVEGRNLVIDYRWAHGRFDRLPAMVEELVRLKVDLIVAPTVPQAATSIAGGAEALGDRPLEVGEHFFNLHRLFSLAGPPVVSVPMGFGPGALPLGLQIAGRYLEDDLVLRLGHAFEQLTTTDRRPPLAG